MPLATFDANIWVSSSRFPGTVPDRAIDAIRVGRAASVTSGAIIDQVRHALSGPKFHLGPEDIAKAEAELRGLSRLVYPTVRIAVVTAKESDNRILECAVAGRADVIVTGDRKHLLPLGAHAGISIVSPAAFLRSFGP